MQAELEALSKALLAPKKPVIAIIGGAKVSTKLDLLENLVSKVDALVIGGGMANTFLHAQGIDIGKSLAERDLADTARRILDKAEAAKCAIILPVDAVVAFHFEANAPSQAYGIDAIPADGMILDIGPLSIERVNARHRRCRDAALERPARRLRIAALRPRHGGGRAPCRGTNQGRQACFDRRRRRHGRGAQSCAGGRGFHLYFHRRRRLPGMMRRQGAAGGRGIKGKVTAPFPACPPAHVESDTSLPACPAPIGRSDQMNLAELNKVAEAMVAPGKGILAADESTGTIKKRFDAIGAENTEDNRRDYRELMFRSSEAMSKYISGVILYDETIWQKAKDGTPLVEIIKKAGAIPGIKVDEGTKPLPNCPGELITIGLDKLADRLAKYYEQGARFAKWRAVIDIGKGIPSYTCDQRQCACARALCRALPGRADRADRRAGSADGRRPRHRHLLRGDRMGAEGNLPAALLSEGRARRHRAEAEHGGAGQEEREEGERRRKSPRRP